MSNWEGKPTFSCVANAALTAVAHGGNPLCVGLVEKTALLHQVAICCSLSFSHGLSLDFMHFSFITLVANR